MNERCAEYIARVNITAFRSLTHSRQFVLDTFAAKGAWICLMRASMTPLRLAARISHFESSPCQRRLVFATMTPQLDMACSAHPLATACKVSSPYVLGYCIATAKSALLFDSIERLERQQLLIIHIPCRWRFRPRQGGTPLFLCCLLPFCVCLFGRHCISRRLLRPSNFVTRFAVFLPAPSKALAVAIPGPLAARASQSRYIRPTLSTTPSHRLGMLSCRGHALTFV